MQPKYLIHLVEKRKYKQPEKIKEKALQGPSSDTTSMMNIRFCQRIYVMIFLNITNPIRMAVRSINITKEKQTIISMLTIKQ